MCARMSLSTIQVTGAATVVGDAYIEGGLTIETVFFEDYALVAYGATYLQVCPRGVFESCSPWSPPPCSPWLGRGGSRPHRLLVGEDAICHAAGVGLYDRQALLIGHI